MLYGLKSYISIKMRKKNLLINPNFVNTITNYGNLYFELNDYETAIKNFQKAIKIDNDAFQAYYNLGLVYQSIGDFEKAKENFEKVLLLLPGHTSADKMISRLTKYKKDHPHIKQMEKKLDNLRLNELQKSHLYFSLGKAYEDFNDFDTSFKYIKLGNKSKKGFIKYDLSNDRQTFNNLKEFFTDYKFEDNLKNKKVIFIVGLPRSGTSLVEQIISSHSKIYGCGELDYMTKIIKENFYTGDIFDNNKLQNLDKEEKNKIAKYYIDFLEKFEPSSFIYTDKLPLNFIWIGIIKILLPNSKIVHCIRNPKDNILSLYKNDFDSHLNFTYDFDDLIEFYKEYLDLMKLWKKQLNDEIFDIKYEDIIENQKLKLKDCLNFDVEFEENCLKFYKNKRPIKTVSSSQARKPFIINQYFHIKIMKNIWKTSSKDRSN